MNITPRFEILAPKKLIGMVESMSMMDDKTLQLFRAFMPKMKTIKNRVGEAVFDLRVFPEGFYANFSPSNAFIKWALVEVSDFDNVPNGMKTFDLEGGQYAVFTTKNLDAEAIQYIFTEWLPNSAYVLEDRPNFDVLGKAYQQREVGAEQEIWVPIKSKYE